MANVLDPIWTSVEDELPEAWTSVLVWSGGATVGELMGGVTTRYWLDAEDEIIRGDVTHWMPLPEGPSDD